MLRLARWSHQERLLRCRVCPLVETPKTDDAQTTNSRHLAQCQLVKSQEWGFLKVHLHGGSLLLLLQGIPSYGLHTKPFSARNFVLLLVILSSIGRYVVAASSAQPANSPSICCLKSASQ